MRNATRPPTPFAVCGWHAGLGVDESIATRLHRRSAQGVGEFTELVNGGNVTVELGLCRRMRFKSALLRFVRIYANLQNERYIRNTS